MEKLFIPYELALKLKELGFNEKCIATFDEDGNFELQDFEQNYDTFPSHIIAAPLYQQAFDWFREKHNLHCVIDEYENPKSWGYLINNDDLDEAFSFSSYEEARQACLEKLIELCKH